MLCTVITREERLVERRVVHVRVPLWDGSAGFLEGAAPLVAKLGVGELRLDVSSGDGPASSGRGESLSWLIDGGFVQNVDGRLTILTTGATPVEEIELDRARSELAEANARTSTDVEEMDRISEERRRAQIALTLAQRP